MAGLCGALTSAVAALVMSPADGIDIRARAIQAGSSGAPVSPIRQILMQNTSVDNSERSGTAKYPAALIYCDKLSNTLDEKFRRFSGRASMVVEIRHSQDRLEGIETELQVYVDAICALLDDNRGDLGSGSFYAGGYEVLFDAAGKGGKNFLQRARVRFDVEVSK